MTDTILEMRQITKTYPGVVALDNVSFSCRAGEVHALVGQNGAGKSTLMKVLAGAVQPDSGEIRVKGETVEISNPRVAQELGISIIYQEFNLLSDLSVAENIFLGRPLRTRFGLVDWAELHRQARAILHDRLGVEIDVNELIRRLPVPEQQMVEIAKALSRRSEIFIMDEPSAVLGGRELERLFGVIRAMQQEGVTVIYISHRLAEVFEIADRVTVLRDGEVVGVADPEEVTEGDLIRMMVGRRLQETFPEPGTPTDDVVLSVQGLTHHGEFEDVSFTVRRGEILGLAGMVGAGRTALAQAIFGAIPLDAGEVYLDGEHVHLVSPKEAVEHGVALVPEDRKAEGLVLGLSVRKNVTLPILNRISALGRLQEAQERRIVEDAIEDLDIRTPSMQQEVQYLSGGNQQKVVLGKWLSTNPKVIILDEPTRGIDVGTKAEMYQLIHDLAASGSAIVLISSELPEIIGLSDRVLVMHRGEIAGELSRDEATEEKILTLATGGSLEQPV